MWRNYPGAKTIQSGTICGVEQSKCVTVNRKGCSTQPVSRTSDTTVVVENKAAPPLKKIRPLL